MSRSGYSDDYDDQWSLIRWRGAVRSAIRGKRGQAMIKEAIAALDALPEKKLITEELEDQEGFCTLGALGRSRGVDMKQLDPHDYDSVAAAFGCATALAQEIMYMNDEAFDRLTPEQRWVSMRQWLQNNLRKDLV